MACAKHMADICLLPLPDQCEVDDLDPVRAEVVPQCCN